MYTNEYHYSVLSQKFCGKKKSQANHSVGFELKTCAWFAHPKSFVYGSNFIELLLSTKSSFCKHNNRMLTRIRLPAKFYVTSKYLTEKLLLSQKLHYVRGSHFSQCSLPSRALHCLLPSRFLWLTIIFSNYQ